ncbi:MAG: hypothetical protein Q4Q04_02845 [Methanocorpusculum sp.]|nr:hypothetical protein [Methanocorpusculum sp.]
MAVLKRYLIPGIIVLAVLALLIFLFTFPLNLPDGRDVPVFTIPNKTTVCAVNVYEQKNSGEFIAALSIPRGIRSFDVVFFDNPIPVRSKNLSLLITLYGKAHTAVLTRMDYPGTEAFPEDSVERYGARVINEDGTRSYADIVSYSGYLEGVDDSHVIFTAGDTAGSFLGSIQYPGEYISISSADRADTGRIADIVYSEYDGVRPSYGDMLLLVFLHGTGLLKPEM